MHLNPKTEPVISKTVPRCENIYWCFHYSLAHVKHARQTNAPHVVVTREKKVLTWQNVHLHEVVARGSVPHLLLKVVNNLQQTNLDHRSKYHHDKKQHAETFWDLRRTSILIREVS